MSQKITVCRPTLNILKYSLIWPNENEELDPSKWYSIRVLFFTLITSGWVISVVMHLMLTIKTNTDINLSENIAFIVAFVGLYTMIFCYVKNQKKAASILLDLSNFDDFGIPPNFDEKSKQLTLLSFICFGYTFGGIIVYHGGKLLQIPECKRKNLENGWHEICGVIAPTWVPFDISVFPRWHLLLLYQFVSCQFLMKMTLMISFTAMEMANHLILRIDHLNEMLLNCFDDKDSNESTYKLKRCIQYHQQILGLAKRLNDCFKDGMLVHLTITGVICGCLENQFIKTNDKIMACIHIAGWMLALYVACLGGQHMDNAGNSIPDAIYDSKWYFAKIQQRRDLCFMLVQAQKGLFLQTGSFGVLGYPMFLSVMKMSYSIMALLTS